MPIFFFGNLMIHNPFKALPQYLAPQHTLSWIAGILAESQWIWLKNHLIHYFITRYDVDVTTALSSEKTIESRIVC